MTVKQAIYNRVRVFNKHITNKVLIHIAGKKSGHFSILRHFGRKTGKQYSIPVIAEPIENGFVIALTYGKKVDWYANVAAKGKCIIRWKNVEYPLKTPQFLEPEIALKTFPPFVRLALRFARIQYFLSLSRE
jgi:deazaflavin-dependent oxidoreductase (nitroreductase family)